MIRFTKKFFKCGLAGWCLEIIFTSFSALRRREMTLKGTTSLWMFPIYGSAALLTPLCRAIQHESVFFRGLIYMNCIFSAEYLTGTFLKKLGCCPWDYGQSPWNIRRVIRLDYAPFWFITGLLLEKLILPSKTSSS